MIKFQEQVPSVYPSASRDFQYFCWLIDIVLNCVKHNVDGLYDLPNTQADPKLTELLAMTLGFKVKRNYDQKQLAALVAVLPRIIKYKGTALAVNMAGKALIAASGASGSINIAINGGELEVTLPKALVDISLFTDLLPYILPAGMTCHIIRTDKIHQEYPTEVTYTDVLLAECIPDLGWDDEARNTTGLARLFDVGNDSPEFANYRGGADDSIPLADRLHTGLLINTVIPSLSEGFADPNIGIVTEIEGDNT